MLNESLVTLIARKLSGEASAKELQELATYLQENPEHQYFFEILQNFWNKPTDKSSASRSEDDVLNAHFEHIMLQAEEDLVDKKNNPEAALEIKRGSRV